MSTKNLWGDLSNIEVFKTPGAILKEQADLLASSTKFIIRGNVDEGASPWKPSQFVATLSIVVPKVRYAQTIVSINYPMEIYPLEISDHIEAKRYTCSNEEQFLQKLEAILSSSGVRKILSALLSQSGKSTT